MGERLPSPFYHKLLLGDGGLVAFFEKRLFKSSDKYTSSLLNTTFIPKHNLLLNGVSHKEFLCFPNTKDKSYERTNHIGTK